MLCIREGMMSGCAPGTEATVALMTTSDVKEGGNAHPVCDDCLLELGRALIDKGNELLVRAIVTAELGGCDLCGRTALGFAFINDKRYCHGDASVATSCYEQAQQFPVFAS